MSLGTRLRRLPETDNEVIRMAVILGHDEIENEAIYTNKYQYRLLRRYSPRNDRGNNLAKL
jgi:hypothetical protein